MLRETGEPQGAPHVSPETAGVEPEEYVLEMKDLLTRIEESDGGDVQGEEIEQATKQAFAALKSDLTEGRISPDGFAEVAERITLLSAGIGRRSIELIHKYQIDKLTGLPKADHFRFLIGRMEKDRLKLVEERDTRVLSVAIVVDGNDIKEINDDVNLGHTAGNLAIQAIAETIKRVMQGIRPLLGNDVNIEMSRWGGDEFVIAIDERMPEAEVQEAEEDTIHNFLEPIFQRLRNDLTMSDFNYNGETISVAATVGFGYDIDLGKGGFYDIFMAADEDVNQKNEQRRRKTKV